jgi:hypothetical protein
MRRRSNVIRINRIASEVGEFTQNMYSNTQSLVKDVSKEISSINWEGMYKSAHKSIRLQVKKGNKTFARTLRKARRTNAFKVASKRVPRYFTLFNKWSSVQLRKLQNFTSGAYQSSRRWMMKNSPQVKSFVKEYYPKVGTLVLSQIPAYRIAFSKAF